MAPGSLKTYRKKRDFRNTPEPKGKSTGKRGKKSIFVIHKHAARQLHYDFRLQVGRALKSWAVPKGPSPNPGDKRMAAEVEDHPLDYAKFEGVIPKGEYGAGTVLIWDKGTYRNVTKKDHKEGATCCCTLRSARNRRRSDSHAIELGRNRRQQARRAAVQY